MVEYSVVIPAHNESKNLPILINGIEDVLSNTGNLFEIIIVNDNSTDDSLDKLKEIKKDVNQLKIIDRVSNPGVGNSIRSGFDMAKGRFIIGMDGDLSHTPEDIPKFLDKIKDCDMVCGSRYVDGGVATMEASRTLISSLFNTLFRVLLGIPVRDFTSGFRVYRAEMINGIDLNNEKFGIYIEIPIKAHLSGFKLSEVPITYHKRGYGNSNLNYFKQGPEYLKVILMAINYKIKDFLLGKS